jgi:hypothetical protein
MAWRLDARIPLTLLEDPAGLAAALAEGKPAAVLRAGEGGAVPRAVTVESFVPLLPHQAGCACCGGRSPAAVALDLLFQARLRGRCGWFDRVVAVAETPAAQEMLRAALANDAVTAARFREG